jgi:hypothetical protein
MKNTMEQTVTVDEASVSRVAYELWENAGRPAGRDLEFWLAAEAQVRGSLRKLSVATASVETKVEKTQRATRPARSSASKTWPKPYPSLPKF